jgi:hypothetical protein
LTPYHKRSKLGSAGTDELHTNVEIAMIGLRSKPGLPNLRVVGLKRIEDTPREEVLPNNESAMAIADIYIPKDSTATRGPAEGRRSSSEINK